MTTEILKRFDKILFTPSVRTVSGVPEGFDAAVIGDLAKRAAEATDPRPLLYILQREERMEATREALSFFAPDVDVVSYPAWDCLPYDRVSPSPDVVAQRIEALTRLAFRKEKDKPLVVLTTSAAATQRVMSRNTLKKASFQTKVGDRLDRDKLLSYLQENGYGRAATVAEPGDFALRGSLIDLFPPGAKLPYRIDMFGDEVETIRRFDPADQRSRAKVSRVLLLPAGEIRLDEASRNLFRAGYKALFGAVVGDDPLYEAISDGRNWQGAEHWMPLFTEKLESLFDYLPDAHVFIEDQAIEAATARFQTVSDYFEARQAVMKKGESVSPYKPLPPERLYITEAEWKKSLDKAHARTVTPFETEAPNTVSLAARRARDFAPERAATGTNVYEALKGYLSHQARQNKRTLIAASSDGARERFASILGDHGVSPIRTAESWASAAGERPGTVTLTVLPLEHGFETEDLVVLTEQDILGDRLVRRTKRSRAAEEIIREVTSLSLGDLVVHLEHGIGRYDGLETIEVGGAPHDCVRLIYAGNDRLYVPVENIDVLSRYGSDGSDATLDKLGSGAWQARKAKMKKRIRDMADELIKIAAARQLRQGALIEAPDGHYQEFCARFPYTETDDQAAAIEDVLGDLSNGRPMDRLVCGDVGFGKTEVALRAAFAAVMAGHQVAIVCPTTLLARQHFASFAERFNGLPVRVMQLSRLVSAKDADRVRDELKEGTIDIVIGTHALLAKGIGFKRLGLLIVDEEQHFGVSHKERLKQLKADVHVLTLTATPIPRTLQLAMTGIRDLSLIATPPVDRLAVRTFVAPFDSVGIREALLREHYRGGQTFFVVPRIADLDEAEEFLKEHVPEVRYIRAHGQMPATALEDVMTAFYEGRYEVLLSTTIIESGIDIPRANTLIVYKAQMFGLAQLYQIRGRVGRSKIRAYAYLTLPERILLTDAAKKRLEVIQTLDTLGAGFTLASHDLDIRGAGNLLGDEQSGHIREVGVELYQTMLEEAVSRARAAGMDRDETEEDEDYSPQIALGATVLIPDGYVDDLDVRLTLYRKLGDLTDAQGVEGFAAELIDRFGALPDPVKQLLAIVKIKIAAKAAGVQKIDAGPKGATISFHKDRFANPAGLVQTIAKKGAAAKIRPDQKLVYFGNWPTVEARLNAITIFVRELAALAAPAA